MPITLTEILTGHKEVEDIYIDDEDILQETYEIIFMGKPTLPATAEVPALPAPAEISATQASPPLLNSENATTSNNVIPMEWFPVLEPPIAPLSPPLPNSVAADNIIPMS